MAIEFQTLLDKLKEANFLVISNDVYPKASGKFTISGINLITGKSFLKTVPDFSLTYIDADETSSWGLDISEAFDNDIVPTTYFCEGIAVDENSFTFYTKNGGVIYISVEDE